jgi:hypothetical protein
MKWNEWNGTNQPIDQSIDQCLLYILIHIFSLLPQKFSYWAGVLVIFLDESIQQEALYEPAFWGVIVGIVVPFSPSLLPLFRDEKDKLFGIEKLRRVNNVLSFLFESEGIQLVSVVLRP